MSTLSPGVNAGWVESFLRTGEYDRRSKGGIERRFTVVGVETDNIMQSPQTIVDPTNGALPAYGTFHPTVGGMILDRYIVNQTNVTNGGNKVHEVTAQYSNDRRYVGPPHVDPTGNNGTRDARPTFERAKVAIDIPFAKRVIENRGDPSEIERYVDDAQPVTHDADRLVLTIHFSGWNLGMQRLVSAQTGTVHKIRGNWMRFEAGDAIPIEDTSELTNVYEVEYIWIEDHGTPSIGSSNYPSQNTNPPQHAPIVYPPAVWVLDAAGTPTLDPFNGMARPPFHELSMDFYAQGVKFPPFFDAWTPYRFDADGWQLLPGAGRLAI